ncbi:MAG: VOC family protein [Phycisphaerales bacterium JB050]
MIAPSLKPTAIHETVLYAPDLKATIGFYRRVFEFEPITLSDRGVSFRINEQSVLLIFQPELAATQTDGLVPPHGATGPGHICFAVGQGTLKAWAERLSGLGIEIEMERGWSTGARSIYFRDPAGNSVEIADGDIWAHQKPDDES